MTEDELADLTERVLDDVLAAVDRDPVNALVVLIDAAACLVVAANMDHGIAQMGLDNALQSAHISSRDYKH